MMLAHHCNSLLFTLFRIVMKTITKKRLSVSLVNSIIPCLIICCSAFVVACSSSSAAIEKTVETAAERKLRIERVRAAAYIRHLGKTFPKSNSVEAVYDAQNLSSQKYEVFGEVVVTFLHGVQPDEIEGVMLAESLERGADAVLLQDLSFDSTLWSISVRGRLIKFK